MVAALWAERHQPDSEADLVVTKKKVEHVREFLQSTLGQEPRLLVLRGPPGCGKAAVLRALCRDLGFELVEWSPAARGAPAGQAAGNGAAAGGALRAESLGDAFLRFLAQTDRYRGLQGSASAGAGAGAGVVAHLRRPRMTLVRDFPFTLLEARGDSDRAADFVDRFRTVLQGGAVHRAAFCFNETLEEHRAVTRLFTQLSIATATVHFDGVPRTFAQRALDAAAKAEGLDSVGVGTAALAAECGGDLRHALNALQLASSCAPRAPANGGRQAKRGRGGGRGKASQAVALTQASAAGAVACTQDAEPGGGEREASGAAGDNGMRSAALGLFHALGRLMYCKRIPPEGYVDGAASAPPNKRLRRNNSAVGANAAPVPLQLRHDVLVPKTSRPPLYFVPEEVMEASNTEPHVLVDWVFTNAPRFFGDIGDLAHFTSSLADVDAWGSTWHPGAREAVASPLDALGSAVQVRSVLDANLHPMPPQFADPAGAGAGGDGVGAAASAFNMARPLWRDAWRHRSRRLEELNSFLEMTGPQALGAAAAGHTLVTQTLPFVHLMLLLSCGRHPTLQRLPHKLMKLIMELQSPIDSDLLRAGVKDGPAAFGPEAASGLAVAPWASSLAEDPIEDD